MGKKLLLSPVSRIEGHVQINLDLDDSGNVAECRTQVTNLRGFERFCLGRPVEEMPRITTSICGVCPTSHHMCSSKANDAVFGVEPHPTGRLLRELNEAAHFCTEHILHFYFLAGADFVMGPGAPVAERNVFGIVKKLPDVGKQVVRARWLSSQIGEIVGGRAIHPVAGVPGGWSKPLMAEEKDKCLGYANEVLELAKFSIKYAKENIFPNYDEAIKTIGDIKTGFLGTVTDDGTMDMYDGKARLMDASGEYKEFEFKDYTDHIKEHVEPWTYLKFPYDASKGFSLDPDDPKGIYRTNALARINVCDKIRTPLANEELKVFRDSFGRPAQLTLLYHWARLIELLYNAEYTVQLLENPEITKPETRIKVNPPGAARGVASVEAPRGTLIHDYETDDKGLITNLNLIVGTTHNNGPINMSVKQTAKAVIKDGAYDEEKLNMLEMAIRAYDPCISCATHNLDGSIRTKIVVRNHKGKVLNTWKN